MRATIIGATGFIGRRLSEVCLCRSEQITALVRDPRAAETLKKLGIHAVIGDLADEDAICRACAHADVVFNLAGLLGGWGASERDLEAVNALAPGRVVRCAADARAERVIHVSTAGVSGPLPRVVAAAEDYPPQPMTAYQRTKLAGEEAALFEHFRTGMPLTIVRPAFVYGPGDSRKLSLFRAVARRRFVLVDRGSSRLHPIYAGDLVEGLLSAAAHSPGKAEIYILAGPRPVTVRKLVETIAWALAVPAPAFSAPKCVLMPMAGTAELAARLLHIEPILTRSRVDLLSANYAYCTDKARRELGFRALVDLPTGVKSTAEWYREKGLL